MASNSYGRRLLVDASGLGDIPQLGASVAVNGICLTVTEIAGRAVAFDVIQETLRRSNLGALRSGESVNLERSLKIGDHLDGHFVQGHVDGNGVIRRVISHSKEHLIWIEPDATLLDYITPKGSIAVDGISLTVAECTDMQFSVAIIPTTLARTNLRSRRVGDSLNLETDMLVRALVHYSRRTQSPAHSFTTSDLGP